MEHQDEAEDGLRIAADCSCLTMPRAGVGNYALNVMREMQSLMPAWRWSVFDGLRWSRGPLAEAGPGLAGGALKQMAAAMPFARDAWRLIRRNAFARLPAGEAPDIVFAPDFVPSGECFRVVPVVHDLTCVRFPEFLPPARRRRLSRLGDVIAKAPAIIAVSAFTRRELVEVFGIAEQRIVVAPPGVGAAFAPPSGDVVRRVLGRYHLEAGRYFLSVATQEPRKNLGVLLAAHAGLPAGWRDRWPLVLAGGAGWGRPTTPEAGSRVRRLGYVHDDDLSALYAGASALCVPSLYEGFGLLIIEAMACGTPVLASTTPGLDEASGDVALRLPPEDPAAWAEAMRHIAEDGGLKQGLGERGRRHAAGFSWTRTATTVARVLEAAARP